MAKDIAVYGIYPNRMMVERAVEELTDAGFRHADISVLFPADENTKELTVEEESLVQERAGIGPFIAAGPIMAALAGAGAGGLFGGVTGALIGAGIPEYEAKHYERRLKEGWILLSVHADDRVWKNKGKDILEQTGAEDIKAKAEPHVDH